VFPFLRVATFFLSLPIALAPSMAQEYHTTEQWRAKYDRETDPIRKAKLLPPLGESEFKDAQTALAGDKIPEALDILKTYLDEAQTVQKALDAKIADPEKHVNGYKQLQISIRGALRRLDSMIVGLAGDDKPPFVEIRSQLDDIDRHLIQQLFPKQPANTEPTKPKK
jgi:hypothetical protein